MSDYLLIQGLGNYGLLIARLIIGAAVIIHGIPKVGKGKEKIMDMMRSKGIPGPITLITGYFELIGGLLLVIGLGVQIVALLMVLKYLGNIYVTRNLFGRGFFQGYETDIIYVAIFLALFMLGAGAFSVDSLIIPRI